MAQRIDYKKKKFLDKATEDQQDLDYILETTALSLQGTITETRKDVKLLKSELASLKQEYPLNLPRICDVKERLMGKENALEYLLELKEELGLEVKE